MSARKRDPNSPWYSTPQERRGRPSTTVTLSREILDALEVRQRAEGQPRSVIVEEALAAYLAKELKRLKTAG